MTGNEPTTWRCHLFKESIANNEAFFSQLYMTSCWCGGNNLQLNPYLFMLICIKTLWYVNQGRVCASTPLNQLDGTLKWYSCRETCVRFTPSQRWWKNSGGFMFSDFFHSTEGREKKEKENMLACLLSTQKRGTHTEKWLKGQNGTECDLCLIWALGFIRL